MNSTKKPWQSMTIISVVGVFIVSMFGQFGIDAAGEQSNIQELIVGASQLAGTALAI